MQKTIILGDSILPLVGFGTYYIANDDAQSVVIEALKQGYRHIDTAHVYQNEEGIGQALQYAMKEMKIKRDELFITTKLWPGNLAWGDAPKNFEETVQAFKTSLDKLQLEYIDLYLIHAPFAQELRIEQWKALVALKNEGKIKHIGVSNYNIMHLEEIKATGLPMPEVNQIELHPWTQKEVLRNYMEKEGILPIAYSSLVPLSSWRDSAEQDSAKTDELAQERAEDTALFQHIATQHGVSEAQVLLRWAVQQGIPVIPKSMHANRMAQNLDLFSFSLTNEEMIALKSLNKGGGVAWQVGDPIEFAD